MDLNRRSSGSLPSVIVTGASGLVGRHFIEAFRDRFFIYAIARRGQKSAGVGVHENVHWYRCDIGDGKAVSRFIDEFGEKPSVDYIFHFAGYYDFDYRDSPEFRRTNVDGTRHLLEAAERLGVKRFIFSSSLAVSDFRRTRRVISEKTPADADYPYARSKREAEELVAAASKKFPCTIARLAAVYSDWCEYAPLYVLLNTWLADRWRSKMIAGKGETAIPYIHVNDLNCFWMQVLEKHEELGELDFLAASPSGCVSHNELYAAAQGYGEGAGKSVHLPVWFATVGVALLRFLGVLIGRPPFERPWMMRYIDSRMIADAEETRVRLGWSIKPRFHVMRRLLFMIENMKRDPRLWEQKNLAMTKQAVEEWPGLKIYNAMAELKEEIITAHVAYLTAGENRGVYPNYQKREWEDLRHRSELMYQMLESSIRLGDHLSILTYANYLARRRHGEGIAREELTGSLEHVADLIEDALKKYPGLEDLHKKIHFEISITMQIILDEVEDAYETLNQGEGRSC